MVLENKKVVLVGMGSLIASSLSRSMIGVGGIVIADNIMNRTRKKMKILESATCDHVPNNTPFPLHGKDPNLVFSKKKKKGRK